MCVLFDDLLYVTGRTCDERRWTSDVVYGNVCAGGFETVSARGVMDSLHGTVIVHVRVTAFRHAVRVTGLGLGRGAVRVTVRVLAVFVLRVVLGLDRGGVRQRLHGHSTVNVTDGLLVVQRGHLNVYRYGRRRVTDYAGVRGGRRCRYDVRGRRDRVQVRDVRWRDEFRVLDGYDVSGRCRCRVTGQQRVETGAAFLATGEDNRVLGIVEVSRAGWRQRSGQFHRRVD